MLLYSPDHSPSQRRRIWPERQVADFLVSMFLTEMNRVQEVIHAPSFQAQYTSWWMIQESNEFAGENNMSDEDLNFGLLVIRICLIGVQSLPHSRYPTTAIIKTHPNQLEQWLYAIADEIDKSLQSKKPSLVTVQHRYCHVLYLKNSARIRESWSVLSATVKDAHEIGLHLKDPGVPVSDLEMEIRRRTFWTLYVWDRFMSTFFGHWPLIPEGYFDVDLPHDTLEVITITPYVHTPFTDRIFHMKLARFMTAFMSPPSWQHDRVDSIVIADFTQRFQQVIIDQLPPVFWIENPDTRWDVADTALPAKREMLRLFIWATKASLYKAFADPCNSLQQEKSPVLKNGSDLIALHHRRTLMSTTCKVISCITNLYTLLGDQEGGAGEKLFLLPTSLVEALSNLGICLLSIQSDKGALAINDLQLRIEPDLQSNYLSFFEGFSVLNRHSSHHAIAKKGVKILETLHNTLRTTYDSAHLLDTHGGQQMTAGSLASSQGHGAERFQLENNLISHYSCGGKKPQQAPLYPLPEWLPSFLASPGRSWLFHDEAAFRDLMA
ncbi:hypothetical protein N7456_004034 [Penicillium angulare]|uniref:Xylanolytic transcriptional activator regulatory domain-containing protein n=1 Tax=Penicillium angulare TaxID=116970 RepID=A0A9W9FVW7_9EURO|nr:hypothetical protein N7456_004034 [Penicillium angulare]